VAFATVVCFIYGDTLYKYYDPEALKSSKKQAKEVKCDFSLVFYLDIDDWKKQLLVASLPY
jgi:hypothetical protein